MTSGFFAEPPNMGISSAPAVIDVLDRVVDSPNGSQWQMLIRSDSWSIVFAKQAAADLGRCLNLIDLSNKRNEMSRMRPAT
jgi:hypothetical protein